MYPHQQAALPSIRTLFSQTSQRKYSANTEIIEGNPSPSDMNISPVVGNMGGAVVIYPGQPRSGASSSSAAPLQHPLEFNPRYSQPVVSDVLMPSETTPRAFQCDISQRPQPTRQPGLIILAQPCAFSSTHLVGGALGAYNPECKIEGTTLVKHIGLSEFLNQIYGEIVKCIANGSPGNGRPISDIGFPDKEQYGLVRVQHVLDSHPIRLPIYFKNFEPGGYFYHLMRKRVTSEDFDAFFTRLETEIQIMGTLPSGITIYEARKQFSEYTGWRHLNGVFRELYPEFLLRDAPERAIIVPMGHSGDGLYCAAGKECTPDDMLEYWQSVGLTRNIGAIYLPACNTGSERLRTSGVEDQEIAKKRALFLPKDKRPFAIRVKGRLKRSGRSRSYFNPKVIVIGTVGSQMRFPVWERGKVSQEPILCRHGFKQVGSTARAADNTLFDSDPFIIHTPPPSP